MTVSGQMVSSRVIGLFLPILNESSAL